MSIIGIEIVNQNIRDIFKRREATLYALCLFYAAKCVEDFNKLPFTSENPWNNQTYQAKDRVFGDAFRETEVVGFFMAHGVEYGPYLEFKDDGKNAAIWPVVRDHVQPFLKDLKELYGAVV